MKVENGNIELTKVEWINYLDLAASEIFLMHASNGRIATMAAWAEECKYAWQYVKEEVIKADGDAYFYEERFYEKLDYVTKDGRKIVPKAN